MNMSTWSIRHPVPPIALFVVLVIVGVVSFIRLPVTQFPTIDLPLIRVSISQPGAGPSELVTQVVQPIEDSIASGTGVRHITSTTSDGAASIQVEFELEVDSDRALNDVKDAVAKVRGNLPQGLTEPVVERLDITGIPILIYAVSDPQRSIEELSKFTDDVISRQVQSAEGVGQVSRIGGSERQINVDLDPDRLLALGLTAADVSRQLRNKNVDMGGGRGDLAGSEYTIRAIGSADTIAELAQTPIAIANGHTVRLDQIGTIRDGGAELRSFATLDNTPVVAFGVFRASGASDLTAGEASKKIIAEIEKANPSVNIALIDDMTTYTEDIFHGTMETLIEGAALAVIVVFLFLRNWRATLISAIALPLSIIPTFFLLVLLGFTLNSLSLLAVTLVTGILVDDAIVEIENIVRHINMGVPAYEASEEAASEIGMTVIAISFSIVAVFAPVSFMSGIAGQYFKQFGLTVAISVLFSLLVARIITPMLAAYFMRDSKHVSEHRDGRVMRALMAVLRWTLRNRGMTLMLGVLIFAGSIFSATLLPAEFIPAGDIGRTNIQIELPPGSTIADNQRAARRVTKRILQFPEVRSVFVNGGEESSTTSRFTVNYIDKEEREKSSFQLEDEIRTAVSDLPDMRIHFLNAEGRSDVQLSVLGNSEESAALAAQKLEKAMKGMPALTGARTAASLRRPEIRVLPKPEIAAQLGVTSEALASTLLVATIGDVESNLAKFNTGDEQVPIVVRLNEEARNDLARVADIRVPSSAGLVPLSTVADVTLASGATQISRHDRRYRTEVVANLAEGGLLGPATAEVLALPGKIGMPEGTNIEAGGDAEAMAEVFGAFGTAMGAGILLVYIVLVLLFSSFITPLTILMSLPMAIGGAIFALFLTGNSISLPVIIGFLMLMGIVTKNAIMLVEFAITSMRRGVPKRESILDAVHKRARPIVMTTIAMTAGMVPSAISNASGAEFSSPMAIAVIGGLLLSTILSLLFVPSLFSAMDALRVRVGRLMHRVLGTNKPQGEETANA